MRVIRLEVAKKPGVRDVRAERLLREVAALGIGGVTRIAVRDVVVLAGNLTNRDLERLIEEVLTDPVVEELVRPERSALAIDVAFRPGVTDSRAETLQEAARLVGVERLVRVTTGRIVRFEGAVTRVELERIARELLANAVIERWAVGDFLEARFDQLGRGAGDVTVVPIVGAGEARLAAVNAERRLALDPEEMRAIADYYAGVGREPTDVELEMLAQTWSEHCAHKTFRARVEYTERGEDGRIDPAASGVIEGLLASTVRAATEKLARPWVRSAFVDNAGVVAFDEAVDVAFKVETHNHPSALEPFGGANTGVGGVVRDILGVSARPIAVTDVLCFGPLDGAGGRPAGVLHPRRVARGVVLGVEDYGNKMGIPTVSGAIVFDPGYTSNPLVYCGCVGVVPRGAHPTAAVAGDLIVVLGGATGRDGLRGATFSSMAMDAGTGEASGGAVQIGHPVHEKQVQEVVLAAREAGLYHAITDCGAGGLSSAVGEMARELGADVLLERVPLKYAGLAPWEIWLSEAQERMVLAVAPECWEALSALAKLHAIGCDPIGHFTGDAVVTVRWEGEVVASLGVGFLHGGMPQRKMRAEFVRSGQPGVDAAPRDLGEALLAQLGDANNASRAAVVRRYDHEVQGGTVVKPLVGVAGEGPSDGAVLVFPEALDGAAGVALGAGLDLRLGAWDPYAMAWAAVDEAVRNVVAVGADPERVALLDNFCWGDPWDAAQLGGLVRACRGAHDAALAHGAPFVSGKDSLNNTWRDDAGETHAIPPTLLISALGRVPDVAQAVTSDFKGVGDAVYVVGVTRPEVLPPAEAPELFRALHAAMRAGGVRACHDVSEGGVAVAVAEMAIGGGLGVEVDLARVPAAGGLEPGQVAFLERPTRFVVAVAPEAVAAFEAALSGQVFARVGEVVADPVVRFVGVEAPVAVPLAAARAAFLAGAPQLG